MNHIVLWLLTNLHNKKCYSNLHLNTSEKLNYEQTAKKSLKIFITRQEHLRSRVKYKASGVLIENNVTYKDKYLNLLFYI